MDRKRALINQLKKFRVRTSKQIPISKMIFFGSRANGKPYRYSDVDLVVVSGKFRDLRFRRRATKMYDFWDINLPVDFLCYTPEEFKKLSKQITIVREAVKNGIEI